MLKLFIVAAILACTNAYYNHGQAHQSYYGNYGHQVVGPAPIAAAPVIPVNPHNGNLYNPGYGNHGLSSSAKIIEATYPGAVHKTSHYPIANTGGYVAPVYPHNSINHPGSAYVHAPTAIASHSSLAYNYPGTVPIAPSISHNHASLGNYGHSRYAVTEGPTNYSHSRYTISASPALAYGHANYPVAIAGNGVQKIGYNPIVSHMGYQSHAAQSYAW